MPGSWERGGKEAGIKWPLRSSSTDFHSFQSWSNTLNTDTRPSCLESTICGSSPGGRTLGTLRGRKGKGLKN